MEDSFATEWISKAKQSKFYYNLVGKNIKQADSVFKSIKWVD